MARPSPLSAFGDLPAAEIADVQSGAPGMGPQGASTALVRVPAPRPRWAVRPPFALQARPQQPHQQLPGQPQQQFLFPHQRPLQHRPQQRARPSAAPYPRQRPPSQRPPVQVETGSQDRYDRPFPVRREFIREVFESLLKKPGFQLPAPARPDQARWRANPCYCPYHGMMGHMLEDCLSFRYWLESSLAGGTLILPAVYLVNPPTGSVRIIISPPASPASSGDYFVDAPGSPALDDLL